MRVRTPTKAVMHRVHRREHLPVHRADAVHPDAAVEVVRVAGPWVTAVVVDGVRHGYGPVISVRVSAAHPRAAVLSVVPVVPVSAATAVHGVRVGRVGRVVFAAVVVISVTRVLRVMLVLRDGGGRRRSRRRSRH